MEHWDLYDRNGNSLHKTQIRGPTNKGEYHIEINVWIKNNENKILLTKRDPNKSWPNKWECTGGSILAGEKSISGAIREVKEEIGININNISFIERVIRDEYPDFIIDTYLCIEDINIEETILQEGEVIDIKWCTKDEIKEMVKTGEIAEPLNYIVDYIEKRII
jgi:mutator protein MutT